MLRRGKCPAEHLVFVRGIREKELIHGYGYGIMYTA